MKEWCLVSRYKLLTCKLLSLLDGDILPLPQWGDLERNEQRVAIAVCESTEMTLDYWAKLDSFGREPWLEKAIAQANSAPADEKAEGSYTEPKGKKPATVNQRMAAMLQEDATRVDWPATKWAEKLGVTPAAIKQTQTWKKQIKAARILMRAERADHRR